MWLTALQHGTRNLPPVIPISYSTHVPPNLTPSQQHVIQKQVQHYFVQNQQLYRRNHKHSTQPLLVIKTNEVESILHNIHNEPLGGHLARDITYNKIWEWKPKC